MHIYIDVFSRQIPTYGLMICLGVLTANLISLYFIKREKLDIYDMIILEAYIGLGGYLGAKGLFLWINRHTIEWSRLLDAEYFSILMRGGFVFYGGLIGGFIMIFLCKLLHRIDVKMFVYMFAFCIPWVHSFGRIGCFLAGCCYGIPYDGPGAVIFPENGVALSGVPLFPIQLVESACLMVIAIILLLLSWKGKYSYTLETYLILYAPLRFGLEKLRYDQARGALGPFSTSQWISIFMLLLAIGMLIHHWYQRFSCETGR